MKFPQWSAEARLKLKGRVEVRREWEEETGRGERLRVRLMGK